MGMNMGRKSKCPRCGYVRVAEIVSRPVDGIEAATEHGIRCDKCGGWVHACYMSSALEKLREEAEAEGNPAKRARLFNLYNTRFDQFQAAMQQRAMRQAAQASRGGRQSPVVIGG